MCLDWLELCLAFQRLLEQSTKSFADCLRGRGVACWILQISWQLIELFIFKCGLIKANMHCGVWPSDSDSKLKEAVKAACPAAVSEISEGEEDAAPLC